jgi:hypothetical protein
MRSTQFNERTELFTEDHQQASTEVAQDETTESVFSRKDRKAYRAEVLGRCSAKTSKRVTGSETKKVGEAKQTKAKARNSKGRR